MQIKFIELFHSFHGDTYYFGQSEVYKYYKYYRNIYLVYIVLTMGSSLQKSIYNIEIDEKSPVQNFYLVISMRS
jgi:hypothetical protein